MKILILGGTVFVGRALVDAAQSRGHELTLFNRGKSNPTLHPDVESIRGDRDTNLAPLAGRHWDAVIDTCGYVPRIVGQSAQFLAEQVDHYTFISTLSVYGDVEELGIDESGPLATIADPTVEEVNGETYGALKVLCEREVEKAVSGRALIVRPGLIVGPHDPTDRFSYWVQRFDQGGDTLVPGRRDREISYGDARDLASWTLNMIEKKAIGTFNADGPCPRHTMEELVAACQVASDNGGRPCWVDESFLEEQGVEPWSDLPLWIPDATPEKSGFYSVSCARAIAEGLSYRSPVETVRDTLAWLRTRPTDHEWRVGMKREREVEVLAAWQARAAGK